MRRLLVDGYNLLAADPAYARLAAHDFQAARERVVSDIASVAGSSYDDVTVVFDGAGNPESLGEPTSMAGVTITYSPYGVEADAIIERLAHEARGKGDDVVVVTTDLDTRWAVLGGGVSVVSSQRFLSEMHETVAEWGEHVPAGSTLGRVEDRIDPTIRARLRRWLLGGRHHPDDPSGSPRI